jgi:heptaprenyl diphosphate synthase
VSFYEEGVMMENIRQRTTTLTLTAMMFALIMVFSVLESTFTPLLSLPPGVRIGLTNIVVMCSLFYINKPTACTLVLLKSVFVFITRGTIAGLLSFSGGIAALIVMILLIFFFKERISILILSIVGAITHNVGQLLVASLLLNTNLVLVYLPILLVSGIIVGSITGSLLRVTLPLISRATNALYRK